MHSFLHVVIAVLCDATFSSLSANLFFRLFFLSRSPVSFPRQAQCNQELPSPAARRCTVPERERNTPNWRKQRSGCDNRETLEEGGRGGRDAGKKRGGQSNERRERREGVKE